MLNVQKFILFRSYHQVKQDYYFRLMAQECILLIFKSYQLFLIHIQLSLFQDLKYQVNGSFNKNQLAQLFDLGAQ